MSSLANRRAKAYLATSSERELARRLLVAPNPGDIMMVLIFGWALFCFYLVTVGESALVRIARLARSDGIQELLLSSSQGLAGLMVIGCIALVVTIAAADKFPRLFLPGFLFGMTFANASWKPLHDVAFALKYLSVIYIGAYAALFLYNNFWRLISTPYVRVMMVFLGWIGVISVFVGGRLDDFWYIGTAVAMLAGMTIGWFYEFNNRFGVEEFFQLVAWAGIAILLAHMSAPFISNDYIQNGRFQSYYVRATGFSISFVPIVVTMFWMSMAHRNPQVRLIFTFAALAGFALILWSGSRSPVAATLAGVALLWLRFRSPVFLLMLFLASLALAVQLIFRIGSGVDVDTIASRFENAETGRFELWVTYLEVAADSWIYGYSPSGMKYALAGDLVGRFLQDIGADSFQTKGSHNSFLGLLLRFGVIGVILFMSMVLLGITKVKAVLTSAFIPDDEKRVYILPATLIPIIMFTVLFEDRIPGAGKGSGEELLLYASLFVCQVYGSCLLNQYDFSGKNNSQLETLAGLKTASQRA